MIDLGAWVGQIFIAVLMLVIAIFVVVVIFRSIRIIPQVPGGDGLRNATAAGIGENRDGEPGAERKAERRDDERQQKRPFAGRCCRKEEMLCAIRCPRETDADKADRNSPNPENRPWLPNPP